jgi:hypothetical protein
MGGDEEAWADPFAVVLFDRLAGFLVVTDGARERAVRVPGGEWIALATGERLTGPLSTSLPAPLGAPPLLLPAGHALVLDRTSDTLLKTTVPGRVGLSFDRVVVVGGPGPASLTEAGGLVVEQTPEGDGLTVSVTRGVEGALVLEVAGAYASVSGDGVVASEPVRRVNHLRRLRSGSDCRCHGAWRRTRQRRLCLVSRPHLCCLAPVFSRALAHGCGAASHISGPHLDRTPCGVAVDLYDGGAKTTHASSPLLCCAAGCVPPGVVGLPQVLVGRRPLRRPQRLSRRTKVHRRSLPH